MTTNSTTPATGAELNLDEIQAKISGLSKEELVKQLLDIKVRQRVTSKKYYNPDTAKKARLKRSAAVNAMVLKAKELGIYDQILKEASELADEKLAEAEADTDVDSAA